MNKRYGLVIDLDRCIGCQACRISCKVEHSLETDSGIRVETVGGAHPDTPAGRFPHVSLHYLPIPCMHCGKPSCLDACPVEAIYKRKDGIVLVDEEKCTGCRVCIDACPYDAITYDSKKNVVQKCTLCHHRIDEGLEPFCVVCCEGKAMFFGEINNPDSKTSNLIVRKGANTLKSEAGTAPAVYYCPVASRLGI